jgi:hypothetical protein
MKQVMSKFEIWKESVLIFFDNAYAFGKSPEEILAEVKDIVTETELGDMGYTLEQLMTEWKADRGIV